MNNASNRDWLAELALQYDGPIPPAELARARTGRADALQIEEMRANVALLADMARRAARSGLEHRRAGESIEAGRALARASEYAGMLRGYRDMWKAHCARRRAAKGMR